MVNVKSTNKNFVYNVIYQIFIFIIPLISAPYVSRVLGVENVGIYSYTYSIVYYFMLLGLIGINNYGSRTIAKVRDDREKLSNEFTSIYLLQLILSTIMLLIYLVISNCFFKVNKNILFIQSIFLVSVIFDINWLYFGLEKFKITISRNIIIKCLSLMLIFILVKNEQDLWKYTLIMSISTLISQMYLWLFLKKIVNFKKVSIKKIFLNLKPCLVLFVPIISYSIYRVMDKTMIGMFSNSFQLGNYESAEKIINIPISFITALGTIMLPHMSRAKDNELNNKILETFQLTFFLILPMSFGLLVISQNFSRLFFGDEFVLTGKIICLLTPTIIFSSIANVIRNSYLIPKGEYIIYVKSTMLGAAVNLLFNLVFIKKYGAYGACIGTILAEFLVMLYQIIKTKNIIDYLNVFKIFIKYILRTLFMIIFIIICSYNVNNIYLKLIIQVSVGVITYFLINYKYIWYDFLGRK